MQSVMKRIYEVIMIVLVMLTILTLWTNQSYNTTINLIVWAAFFLDFLVRFIRSENKWEFLKQNPFLVIAIIPLDQFFQVARVVRIIYLFRIKTITKYYFQPLVDKLTYKSKTMLFLSIFVFLATEALIIWQIEESIGAYHTSLLFIIRQLMFFGHNSGVAPTTATLWLLTITSIIGVILHGLAIQWLFSKLEFLLSKLKGKKGTGSNP
ncbi:transporter [Bacillus tianshenii]|nr:transporter [Bacillus tianshenii]